MMSRQGWPEGTHKHASVSVGGIGMDSSTINAPANVRFGLLPDSKKSTVVGTPPHPPHPRSGAGGGAAARRV